jgi:hypothetical protein
MANVYIESGRPEGSPRDDFVVEDHADHVLATFRTQHEAIEWAKKQGHHPIVARVRHLNDKIKTRSLASCITESSHCFACSDFSIRARIDR